jgi:hypothetical protein
MREHKYRAWHKYGEDYRYPGMIYDNKPGDCFRWLAMGQEIEELMEYIGKINGIELYTNDIIEFRTFDGVGYIGYIEWDDEELCYAVSTTDSTAPYLLLLQNVINFESIRKLGNTFDNPELVEDDR